MDATQTVVMWLSNDYGLYQEAIALAGRDFDLGIDRDDAFQEWVGDMAPDLGGSMFSDMLNHALASVNWTEVSDSFVEEVEA